jgi:adenosine kinase
MKTVITGSIAFDYLMSFPGKFSDHLLPHQLHKISVSFLVDSMRRQRGGIAANIAYTNALLGSRPQVMATAGKDFREYGIWLEEKGVDTSGIVIYEDDFCASFFVNTDEDQNQIASFYAMCAYVKECKALGIAYIYDPSQQIIRLSAEDLENGINGCSILTVNEYELEMIREKTGLIQEDILQRAGGLLLTLGKNGSQIFSGGQKYDIPAVKPRKIVEPTGAGDAFRGGLIRGIQLGLGWDIAGRIGSLAAAYVLENLGTQGHNFTISEFIERYRENFDDQGTLDMLLSE